MQPRGSKSSSTSLDSVIVQQYLEDRINGSWISVLNSCAHDIVNTMFQISAVHYKHSDSRGFNYVKKKSGVSFCYPRLTDCLMPFRLTSASKIKVVILGDEPLPNGASGGIMWTHDKEAYGLIDSTTNKYYYSPNLTLMETFLQKYRADGYTDIAKNDPPVFDMNYLMDQGVLPLYSSFTCDSNSPSAHYVLWKQTIKLILKAIIDNDPERVVVAVGLNARDITLGIDIPYVITTPDIQEIGIRKMSAEKIARMQNPLEFVNDTLASVAKNTINW